MRPNQQLGMIGFGAIGREVMAALSRLGESDTLSAVLVRPGRDAPCAVHDVQALIAARPQIVLECAGHSAVKEFAAPLLRAGIDVIISSIGVLADDQIRNELLDAERGGGRALLPERQCGCGYRAGGIGNVSDVGATGVIAQRH
ncbi:MAG: hypothetical protein SXG53_00705 [Pseudomonadota bacterium]|nr:hypothetical protein [Pseudomonadota bacterium]